MSTEIELKLLLPASARASLIAHPLLQNIPAEQFTLSNIYCDTPQQALTQAGIALRLRNKGSQWLQTLKTRGEAQGGLHARQEWEMPIAGPALEWGKLPKEVLPAGLKLDAVQPLFETTFERHAWQVIHNDSVIELVLDQGLACAGDATQPIGEIELELVSGTPADLFSMAEQLATSITLLPSDISKAERGYRLVNGVNDWPKTPNQNAPLAVWASALCRQCEALPSSREDLKHTLVGLSERGDIHAGLLHGLLTALQEDVLHWGDLPGMRRLGQWMLHHSAVL
ncbi:CYTH domain-containing protein [Salinispirillum sp. LH 10-3-1]|uniref:CYTH domain-containing protein n=1 Tax=Salinispirillum sp. LH 10-3-1 TaxID=2952525 RepID=A0AB38YDQ2_9GAMM